MLHPRVVGIFSCIVAILALESIGSERQGRRCVPAQEDGHEYNNRMRPILNLSIGEKLRNWMLEHDQRPYRAAQIRKWIYEKRAGSWEQMTDLPRGLREQLASEFDIWSAEIAIHRKDDDGTENFCSPWPTTRSTRPKAASKSGKARPQAT